MKTYVDVDIFQESSKKRLSELNHLPDSCQASGEALDSQREVYLKYGVFTGGTLDGIINYHKSFKDKNLRESLKDKPEELLKLVRKYFHCG